MKYIEIALVLSCIILMPITFFNIIEEKYLLIITLQITGFFYLISTFLLVQNVSLISLLKTTENKNLNTTTMVNSFLLGLIIFLSFISPGCSSILWRPIIVTVFDF